MILTEPKPLAPKHREPIIDILRGWALLGVATMNCVTIFAWNTHAQEITPSVLSERLQKISEALFESKGWTLLALLFGYGFSVLLHKIEHNAQNPYRFFIKRMFWLWVLALLNTVFFGGDILHDYALMGLLLLGFYRCNTQTLYKTALAILLLTPALQAWLGSQQLLFTPQYRDGFYALYDAQTVFKNIQANFYMRYLWMLRPSYSIILHLIQLGCFILGMALERSRFFESLAQQPAKLTKAIVLSMISSVLLYLAQQNAENNEWASEDYYRLYYPTILSIMTCTTAIVCWLYYQGYFKTLFAYLQITGRMTLTHYLIQNILWFAILVCLRPTWSWVGYFGLGLGVFVLQCLTSRWWLARYRYGMFEWLWRCLTYGKWDDFRS